MASNYTNPISSSGQFVLNPSSTVSASLNVGGVTAVSSPSPNKLVIGQTGCEVEIAGNLTFGGNRCAMCKADAPLGVLLSGEATRVLFCFACAVKNLHGSVKELVDSLDVKDKLEQPA
jgi:hypothetical protein